MKKVMSKLLIMVLSLIVACSPSVFCYSGLSVGKRVQMELYNVEGNVVETVKSQSGGMFVVETKTGEVPVRQSENEKAFVQKSDAATNITNSVKKASSPAEVAKKGFWNIKSKTKLLWGLALVVVGGAGAAYGLSIKTEKRNEQKTESTTIDDPTAISLSNTVTYNDTYDTFGRYDTCSISSSAMNDGTTTASNVTIRITASSSPGDLGSVYAQETATISSMVSGGTGNWSAYLDLIPNVYSFYIRREVTHAYFTTTTTRNVEISERKQESPALGYIGVGVAALGLSFLVSYAASSVLPIQKAENLEVNPVMYASNGGSYQGLTLAYRF